MERTRPHGRVIGIDLIPAQPPRGVATFQGDFLSPSVQLMVKNYITESHKQPPPLSESDTEDETDLKTTAAIDEPSYIDSERHAASPQEAQPDDLSTRRLVDVRQKHSRDILTRMGERKGG